MSRKERRRLEVFSRVKAGQLKLAEAAELVELSYRQARRVFRRYRHEGDRGLVHRARGRPGNRRGGDGRKRQQALELHQQHYGDFGPTLAAEYLAQRHGLMVDHETLRRWLIASGFWRVRHDKSRRHRRWRQRKAYRGELVQMDGSHHDWFEQRRGKCVLMVMVDDASGQAWAQFHESQTTEAAMLTFGSYVARQGLPVGLYVDRDSIYQTNRKATAAENLANTGPLTQFGRAMRRLDVQMTFARSPQAKGRVERTNGTLQDRLVKALRVAGISDLDQANAFLEQTFLPQFNAQFAVIPAEAADLHRPLPADVDLSRVLCIEEKRTVGNDWCVQWRGRFLQLAGKEAKPGLCRQQVTVRQKLDGTIELEFKGRLLSWRELPERPARARPDKPSLLQRVQASPGGWKPPADHPWRQLAVPPPAAIAGGALRSGRARCARPPSATIPASDMGTVSLS